MKSVTFTFLTFVNILRLKFYHVWFS